MKRRIPLANATKVVASSLSFSGGWSVPVVSSGDGGSSLRSARTAVSATAAAFVDVVSEDEPVVRQEQQRVDLLVLEQLASRGGRVDHAQSNFASSNGCAAR